MAGEQEAGLLELDFRVAGECELSYFGLAPTFIGSGAGRWLMNRAIALAWSRPVRRFWVHTCTSITRTRSRSICARDSVHSGVKIEISDDPRLTGAMPRNATPRIPIIA